MMVFYFNSVFLPIQLALFTPVVSFFSSSLHMLAPKVPDLQILTAIPHFSFSKSSNKTTRIEAHWHILGHRPPPKLGTTVLMQTTWTKKIGEGDSPKENWDGFLRKNKGNRQSMQKKQPPQSISQLYFPNFITSWLRIGSINHLFFILCFHLLFLPFFGLILYFSPF